MVRRFFFSAALVCFLMVCFMPLSKPDGSAARLIARLALPVRGCHGSGRLARRSVGVAADRLAHLAGHGGAARCLLPPVVRLGARQDRRQ